MRTSEIKMPMRLSLHTQNSFKWKKVHCEWSKNRIYKREKLFAISKCEIEKNNKLWSWHFTWAHYKLFYLKLSAFCRRNGERKVYVLRMTHAVSHGRDLRKLFYGIFIIRFQEFLKHYRYFFNLNFSLKI